MSASYGSAGHFNSEGCPAGALEEAFIDEDRTLAFEKYLKSGSGRAFAKARL